MKLKPEALRLLRGLPSDARCFVRLCRTDDALWVCDLNRRRADWRAVVETPDTVWTEDSRTGLLKVDWSTARWEAVIASLPSTPPPFPAAERLHPAYALCRLWLAHPDGRTEDGLPVLRRVLKLADGPEEVLLAAVPALAGEAAEQLRNHEPVAGIAGRALAAWLLEKEETT